MKNADASIQLVMRGPRAGDIGWIIHRHGVVYHQEYGWDQQFEALVAEIAAKFVRNFDEARERCWIAELDGKFAGCVFLVKDSEENAKLRMFLVEEWARGKGVGRRLLKECVEFGRRAGYKSISLWTVDVLHAARHLYEEAGFQLVREDPRKINFGVELADQFWQLEL